MNSVPEDSEWRNGIAPQSVSFPQLEPNENLEGDDPFPSVRDLFAAAKVSPDDEYQDRLDELAAGLTPQQLNTYIDKLFAWLALYSSTFSATVLNQYLDQLMKCLKRAGYTSLPKPACRSSIPPAA